MGMQLRWLPVLFLVALLAAGCASPDAPAPESTGSSSSSSPTSHSPPPADWPLDGIRVFWVAGVLAVNGSGPAPSGAESCDAAIGWTVDFKERTITQVAESAHLDGNVTLVVAGAIRMEYRAGTSTCFGGIMLAGNDEGALDLRAESGPLGLLLQAGATHGDWTLAGHTLQAGEVASAVVDRPHRHGVVTVADLGVWNRSALRLVDELRDLPGQGTRGILDPPERTEVVHDVWPAGAPQGTYRHLRVTGTLQESGAFYSRQGCGLAPSFYHEDEVAQEAWFALGFWDWDEVGWDAVPARATLLAIDDVGVDYLDDAGCSDPRQAHAAAESVLEFGLADEDGRLRIELAGDDVSVNGKLLPAGGMLTFPISFTQTHDYGSGPATRTYSGDVTVTDGGDWPRAELHAVPSGWTWMPAQHV